MAWSEANLEAGWLDLRLGLLDRDLLRSRQAVSCELVEEWLGEVGVGAAAPVQVDGSPGKRRLLDVVTGGPVVPGVERCEGVLGNFDAAVGVAECSEELAARCGVLAEPVTFAVELAALVEERLGAMGQLVERDLGNCDAVGCVGDRVSGGAPVESAAAGEVLLGLSVSASCSFEVAGHAGDGLVVWGATWGEFGELSGELVDALLERYACPRPAPRPRAPGRSAEWWEIAGDSGSRSNGSGLLHALERRRNVVQRGPATGRGGR